MPTLGMWLKDLVLRWIWLHNSTPVGGARNIAGNFYWNSVVRSLLLWKKAVILLFMASVNENSFWRFYKEPRVSRKTSCSPWNKIFLSLRKEKPPIKALLDIVLLNQQLCQSWNLLHKAVQQLFYLEQHSFCNESHK